MKRRFLAPEVIQTSQMDCGPAALTSLLTGLEIPASYGRLREACQTNVDGTSIDTLEELAVRLGLDALQTILPIDHLMAGDPFPCLLVTKDPAGAPHFVVAWRRVGERIQLMDPGRGRRWIDFATLRDTTFIHRTPVSAETWRAWVASEESERAFACAFARLGVRAGRARLVQAAQRDPTWRSYAALDAALRMAQSLLAKDAIERGPQAASLVSSLFEQAIRDLHPAIPQEATRSTIPDVYWSATPAPPSSEGTEQVMLQGAVLVRVLGRRSKSDLRASPELDAVLREPPPRPLRHLATMLRKDGILGPTVLVLSLVAATLGGAIEALVLRGTLEIGRQLGAVEQRLAGTLMLAMLFALLLVLDLSFAGGVLRMGRHLETRLRVAFLSKIPRLQDRYFQSRPASDMAHRCHAIHPVREVPPLGGRLLRSVLELLVVATGLIWIDPESWLLIALAVAVSTMGPWFAQRSTSERDLRVRSFDGALSRYYLDALRGLMPVRAHGAEAALRREQAATAMEWARAGFDRLRASVGIDAIQQIVGSTLAVLVVFAYLVHSPEPAAMLLLVYWALNVPALGQEIARTALLYPSMRNRLLRSSEPLGALEDDEASAPSPALPRDVAPDAHIVFRDVSVRASGHTILDGVNLSIPKGCHLAVVGASGAGKSSLVGLLLGWHRPASGEVFVDGAPLRGAHLERVRGETAWVDPSVQLWNRSLLANLEYGARSNAQGRMATVLEDAELLGLVERLPDGLQTTLGEGGALVSGGEGQRVRLGRALMRADSRLVLLDEAFRGLDRDRRRALVTRARERWPAATVLCVTHDVSETRTFDRVLVMDEGRVVEDGTPLELLGREGSRYAAMIRADEDAHRTIWNAKEWRRVTVRDGQLSERAPAAHDEAGA
ncbi:ATP-binding cassette domain-containing protein [Pendulispora albinea]|uniref:ATP-binding cassette domain-containing protein n=1 Tax=Pendulispora albinea TaxID=2741071 RepID=A0ABZ2M3U5_9BACT